MVNRAIGGRASASSWTTTAPAPEPGARRAVGEHGAGSPSSSGGCRRAGALRAGRRRSATEYRSSRRIHLSPVRARARCARRCAELLRCGPGCPAGGLDSFAARVHRRAQQVADNFDGALAQRIAAISHDPAAVTSALPTVVARAGYLPTPRRADLEDRLAAVFGTGFGLGGDLDRRPFPGRGAPGGDRGGRRSLDAWQGWRWRGLGGAHPPTEKVLFVRGRWTAGRRKVAAALRTTLEERLSAAESVLVTACLPTRTPRRVTPTVGSVAAIRFAASRAEPQSRLTMGVAPALT